MKNFARLLICFFVLMFGVLLLIFPNEAKEGVIEGIILCGKKVIPSLFPFTVCMLFLQNAAFFRLLKPVNPVTSALFGLNANAFALWLMSAIGGYPIGSKLINEGVKNGEITKGDANKLLCFCVNAGPAFIISAVGQGRFFSQSIGLVLLVSHIMASLVLMLLSRMLFGGVVVKDIKIRPISFADNFVKATADAAQAIMSISGFVILFSAVTELMAKSERLNILVLLAEVTGGVARCNNIYSASFLLGFSGFCIWCQILAVTSEYKIDLPRFILSRVLQGFLSIAFTRLIIKIFGISVPTFSFGGVKGEVFISTPQIAVSLLIMAIVFIISITAKNFAGKITEDIV